MNKKIYQQLAVRVVTMQQHLLLAGSDKQGINSVGGNTNLKFGGAGSGSAYSRSSKFDEWDDEE